MEGYPSPSTVRLRGRLYRIVATRYPPVDLFERHVPPDLMGALWAFEALHDPAPRPRDHPRAQAFGRALRETGAWGLVYRSVRHAGGQCVAALRPPAVSLPVQGAHLVYVWDGQRITQVYERSEPLLVFD